MNTKKRLDQILMERALVSSRSEAQALIMRGEVLIDDVPSLKPGLRLLDTANIRLRSQRLPYVSRGGEKLAGALLHFKIDVSGLVALDVGASTGGFSDCLLKHGASKVYAIDVGYGQLAESLRKDERVEVYEKIHARDVSSINFEPKPQFLVMDLSFISLRKVLKQVCSVLAANSHILLLVKPQFELEREDVSKGGVVKDEKKQLQAVSLVSDFLSKEMSCEVIGFSPSVLRGEKSGNQEYFLFARLS